MLRALKATLALSDPFDACVWAMAACAFWGMMHFGEVSVITSNTFKGTTHVTQKDAFLGRDLNGKPYARLDLPSAKTACAGETQSIFLTPQDRRCPLNSLRNLTSVVPAGPDDPLFSWHDTRGAIWLMVKSKAMSHINAILTAWGWGASFSHSFHIWCGTS